jgi:hypothetical protein
VEATRLTGNSEERIKELEPVFNEATVENERVRVRCPKGNE